MFKVICINDLDKPAEIPNFQWIKIKQEYTVIEVLKLNMQPGIFGFKLVEINLDGCFPFTCYASNRFALVKEIEKLVEVKQLELIK